MRQLSAAVAVTSPQILVSLLKLHVPPAAATAATDVAMVQVDNSKCVSGGGGLVHTGEAIEVLALPFASVPAFVTDSKVAKSTGLMFGLLW